MSGFESLGITPSLAHCCTSLQWKSPMPIQASAIPPALKGNDIIGTSETGSGKTGAFLLPILQNWLSLGRPKGFALILAPTRELSLQIAETAEDIMSNFMEDSGQEKNPLVVFRLIGGESAVDQAIALAWCRHHFIVATPGRLAEHIKQSDGFARHHLSTIKHLVLDEADRMLSLEFADDLDLLLNLFQRPGVAKASKTFLSKLANVLAETNPEEKEKEPTIGMKNTKFPHPQTYLFTATMSKDIRNLRRVALRKDAVLCSASMATSMNDHSSSNKPQSINVDLPAGLSHYCLPVRRSDKLAVLDWILESTKGEVDNQTIVFCSRCHEAKFVAGCLMERGYRALALTGRMKQPVRKRVLAEFVAGKVNVLVATDVAGRGLDLPLVSLVVNYGVPLTVKSYRHRVGRTARAGRSGTAVTIVTRDDGKEYLELESKLLPPLPGSEERRSLSRWPHPIPPEKSKKSKGGEIVGMEKRRRLVGEAWTRAAKVMREEAAKKAMERHAEGNSSDSSEAEIDGIVNDDFDDLETEDLSKQHWASGAAGIAAYREAKRRMKLQKMAKLRDRESDGEGAEDGYEEKMSDDSEDDEERGNLRFDQPIKERRAKKRKAMVASVKDKKKKQMSGAF
ncbi:unnamed protein product [Rodentolepis nana]|uniref:RNA helicase n=1 Tax=Rodentolepis nana TaxID=102285 RepID=A0A0R3TSC1_RODNA|nr:unnamed protein product [Rodentolepis nana]